MSGGKEGGKSEDKHPPAGAKKNMNEHHRLSEGQRATAKGKSTIHPAPRIPWQEQEPKKNARTEAAKGRRTQKRPSLTRADRHEPHKA